MKEIIKKVIPACFLISYKQFSEKRLDKKFRDRNTKEVFTEIYKTNHWGSKESISGPGSEIIQTRSLIADLDKLFDDLNIRTILDIPCGDFNWMKKINFSKINYTGADIVDELVSDNIKQFEKSDHIKFKVLNLINNPLPSADMIIVRDCFVHFSYKDIFNSIKNIKSSDCKYLLTTTYTDRNFNYDIITGGWRKLNFQKKPFSFPVPIVVINEHSTENNGGEKDKSMALWEISKI